MDKKMANKLIGMCVLTSMLVSHIYPIAYAVESSNGQSNENVSAYESNQIGGIVSGKITTPRTASTTGTNIATVKIFKSREVSNLIQWSSVTTKDDVNKKLNSLTPVAECTTNEDGSYQLEVAEGQYDVLIDKKGYLDEIYTSVYVKENVNLGEKALVAGDIDKNGIINNNDIILMQQCNNTRQGNEKFNENCDLDNNGIINNNDLVTIYQNNTKIREITNVDSAITYLTLVAGENIASVSGEGSYEAGSVVNISATLEETPGYRTIWNGWTSSNESLISNQSSKEVGIVIPSENITLTANASKEIINYVISYDLGGGQIEAAYPTSYNVESEEITLPTPTRLGYTFVGWTGSNGNTPELEVKIEEGSTENKTYTANWQKRDLVLSTLTFKENNQDGEVLTIAENADAEKVWINSNVYIELTDSNTGLNTLTIVDGAGNQKQLVDGILETETGTYVVTITTTNGEETFAKNYYIYVDKTAPEVPEVTLKDVNDNVKGTVSGENETILYTTNYENKIEVSTSDANSGIESYLVSDNENFENAQVISVSENYNFTITGDETILYVKAIDKIGNEATVTKVHVKLASLSINQTSLYLEQGKETTLTTNNVNAGELNWTSSNMSVATVDNNGKVFAVAPGTTTIKATSSNDTTLEVTCEITVTYLSLSSTNIILNLTGSNTAQITANVLPEDLENPNVTFRSSNEEIAIVDNTGLITGVGNGNCQIIVTLEQGNVVKTCDVTVQTSPTDLTLDKSEITFDMSGQKTSELTATIIPDIATIDKDVIWSIDNEDVVSLNTIAGETVTVTALQNGTAVITATVNGVSKTCNVTVQTSPTSISIDGVEYVKENGTVTYGVIYVPETSNVNKNVIWSSNGEEVATVDQNGVITAVAAGSASITAKLQNNNAISATKTITVTNLEIAEASIELDLSGTKTKELTISGNSYGTVTYVTSDQNVATVSNTGIVTAVGNGDCVITATGSNGNPSATCNVKVITTPTSITLDKETITLDITRTNNATITAIPTPSTGTLSLINWSVCDPSIVSLNTTTGGSVIATGLQNGTTTITAEVNGISKTCEVTVQTSPTSIILNRETLTMDRSIPSGMPSIIATVEPSTATLSLIEWKTSDASVVLLQEMEDNYFVYLLANKNGTATITAEANGVSDTCKVTVQTSATDFTLDKSQITLDMSGQKTSQLTATIIPDTATINKDIVWSIDNQDVVSLDTTQGENVTVTALQNGTAVITATLNGISKTCNVKVQTTATGISLNYDEVTISAAHGGKATLKATIEPSTANVNNTITWSCTSNSSTYQGIQLSTTTGESTVVSNTNTPYGGTVTATLPDGTSASCKITMLTSPSLYSQVEVGEYVNYTAYDSTNTSNSGWQVLSKNSDGTIDIVTTASAGKTSNTPGSESYVKGILQNVTNTINDQFGSSVAESVSLISVSDAQTIKANTKFNYAKTSYLLSGYYLHPNTTSEYFIEYWDNNRSEIFNSDNPAGGYINPINYLVKVRLKSNIVYRGGNGSSTNENEWTEVAPE